MLFDEIIGWDFGTKEQLLQRMKDWENATLEYNRTARAPLQEELVTVLLSRSLKEVSDILACAIAGGNGEVEPCATDAL